jgi:hypothetical protein
MKSSAKQKYTLRQLRKAIGCLVTVSFTDRKGEVGVLLSAGDSVSKPRMLAYTDRRQYEVCFDRADQVVAIDFQSRDQIRASLAWTADQAVVPDRSSELRYRNRKVDPKTFKAEHKDLEQLVGQCTCGKRITGIEAVPHPIVQCENCDYKSSQCS